LGLDVVGIVNKLGASVCDFKVGEYVYFHGNLRKPGGFAAYTCTTANTTCHLPKNVIITDAAAIPCAGWTAYQALYRKVSIKRGQTVLVTAGSGGVGGFGVQLANLAGANVISTTSTANVAFVKALGAHYVIDYKTEDIKARVMKITDGRGVDVWFDCVSDESATAGLECVAFFGHLICVAGTPKIDLNPLFKRSISVHQVALGEAHNADPIAKRELVTIGNEMIQLLAEKKIDAMVSEVISFQEIPEALARIKDGHIRGKIVAKTAWPEPELDNNQY